MSDHVFRSTDPVGRRLIVTHADVQGEPQLVVRLTPHAGLSTHTALPRNEVIALQEALYEWIEAAS